MTRARGDGSRPRLTAGMEALLRFARPARGVLAVSVALALLSRALELAPFFLLYTAIEALVTGGGADLVTLGLIALGCTLARFAPWGRAMFVSHVAGADVLHDLRVSIAQRLARLPLGYFDRRHSGEVKKVLADDIERLELFLAHAIPEILSAVGSGWPRRCGWRSSTGGMACASIAVVPVAAALIRRAMAGSSGHMAAVSSAAARMNAALVELLDGLPVVKVFDRDGKASQRSQQSIDAYAAAETAWSRAALPLSTAAEVLAVANTAVIVPVGLLPAGRTGASRRQLHGRRPVADALVGPSGAGKTTALNLVAGFFDSYQGAVRIGGVDTPDLTSDQRFDAVSFVFQDVYLFAGTIWDNIVMGRPDAEDTRVVAAAQAAGCHDSVTALPAGYQTLVGEGGRTLSGGEQQRISIARAFLKDAPIVLLDEATAAVDPLNERLVQGALAALVADKTLLVVAHRLHDPLCRPHRRPGKGRSPSAGQRAVHGIVAARIRGRQHFVLVQLGLLAVLIGSILVAVGFGAVAVPPRTVLRVVTHHAWAGPARPTGRRRSTSSSGRSARPGWSWPRSSAPGWRWPAWWSRRSCATRWPSRRPWVSSRAPGQARCSSSRSATRGTRRRSRWSARRSPRSSGHSSPSSRCSRWPRPAGRCRPCACCSSASRCPTASARSPTSPSTPLGTRA